MSLRILVLGVVLGMTSSIVPAAETDAEFQAAKQTFFKEMKKRSASDRADAVTVFAEVARPETAETILKRGFGDPDPQVRAAAQQGLARLADHAEVGKFLLDDLKRSLRKGGNEPLVAELFRALATTDDEEVQAEVVKLLDESLKQTSSRLLIVDPIQSYLGAEVDAHRSNRHDWGKIAITLIDPWAWGVAGRPPMMSVIACYRH